jgi:hypothetical protein
MSLNPEILKIVEQLNQELDEIESDANRGLEIIRTLMPLFYENPILIQLLATLNNSLLFRDNVKRRIQIAIDSISPPQIDPDLVRAAGEDLGELLGRVLETRMLVSRAVKILEDLS